MVVEESLCFGSWLSTEKECIKCAESERCKTVTIDKMKQKKEIEPMKTAELPKLEKKLNKKKPSTKNPIKKEVKEKKSRKPRTPSKNISIKGVESPFREGTTAFIIFKEIMEGRGTADNLKEAIKKSGLKCSNIEKRVFTVTSTLTTAAYRGIVPNSFGREVSKEGVVNFKYIGKK